MTRFEGKVAIITGGAGGIGSATCRRFAAEGARVAVCDRDEAGARKIADEIKTAGGQAEAFACDITDRKAVDAAVKAIESSLGPTSILVNNAGFDIFKPFLKTEMSEWDRLIAINLYGPLNMHHAVLPGMVERRYGRVVNIASDAARVGSTGEAVYAACKSAMLGFTKTLSREHARHGITLNVVCPGPTGTNLFNEFLQGAGNPEKLMESFRRAIPLGRIGAPDDLPGAIAFFASDDAAYCTGQVISVSGGLSMAG
ncbi:3-oxoacyl-[acyl-carrier-protein] reductase FabG [Variibacter gotjawalensis]|uniref:3-oxoacyl-[acyl-carrier-protein] reductase FabG n=1 Tax=Variibacter gotjawalensis TaxID=1333996 RepID=A0A0S3PRF8_9BRAD|nr:glucose 1-dehydrogenase [Variibacter gotjawalensis]NIK48851.1 2-hydroxycyclohexanecarboxyl-CoA dehydrogenase [Variibacter gotjawalensis]RZS50711.1 2-hydroxycyclohexane-1-carbonyl-CoA dehydrogenase [Variibacter gotjawalensis]BAT58545.1 3-oxoacyl-[acyl-carrier-protein] reductase FabG [Variibacter gotjawalensis]